MAIYSGFSINSMVIFHSYVSLPEGKSTWINMNQHESVAAPQRLKEGQQTLRRLEIDALMVIQLAFYGTLNGTLMGFKWGFHGSLIYFNGISLGFI